jgi:hypothetical protein
VQLLQQLNRRTSLRQRTAQQRMQYNPPTLPQLEQMQIAALSHRSWKKTPRSLERTRNRPLTYLQRRIPRQTLLDKRRRMREQTLAMQRLQARQWWPIPWLT